MRLKYIQHKDKMYFRNIYRLKNNRLLYQTNMTGLFKLLYKFSQNKTVKLIETKFKCHHINKAF